jgi:hypothetical protein
MTNLLIGLACAWSAGYSLGRAIIPRQGDDTRMRGLWLFVAFFAWVMATLHAALPADAHWLYSRACCDEHDCRPAKPGEVTRTATGYIVRVDGQAPVVIEEGSAKLQHSPDGQYHLCTYTTYSPDQGSVFVVRCLYRTPEGF